MGAASIGCGAQFHSEGIMRVLVCGGREYADWEFVITALDTLHAMHRFTLVVQGESGKICWRTNKTTGGDLLAKKWAISRGVPHKGFPAMWSRGLNAGFIRNQEMLDYGVDLVVALPGGNGTADMVQRAGAANVHVIDLDQEPRTPKARSKGRTYRP